jgi:hypothetical protein
MVLTDTTYLCAMELLADLAVLVIPAIYKMLPLIPSPCRLPGQDSTIGTGPVVYWKEKNYHALNTPHILLFLQFTTV